MSELKANGGAAYPRSRTRLNERGHNTADDHNGMTLRDYFAGQALVALITKAPFIDRDGEFTEAQTQEYVCKYHADMCNSAYCYSDAMIKERNK